MPDLTPFGSLIRNTTMPAVLSHRARLVQSRLPMLCYSGPGWQTLISRNANTAISCSRLVASQTYNQRANLTEMTPFPRGGCLPLELRSGSRASTCYRGAQICSKSGLSTTFQYALDIRMHGVCSLQRQPNLRFSASSTAFSSGQ
jgi:hypothetical protein